MSSSITPRERVNVLLLATAQALFLIAAVTVMTLSGVVGERLATDPALATLPVAAMMVGTLVTTLPASLFMKRFGRRTGFLLGTSVGGVGGAALAAAGVFAEAFWLFVLGNLLLGAYQAFAMYYRFAAADVASSAFRPRAISLVMAGGVVAAFLGPWNAHHAQALLPDTPEAGPYLVLGALALLAMALLAWLRVPAPPPEERGPARPMAEILPQGRFLVALTAAALGYAVMVLLMTATPLAMRQADFDMGQVALVMQWHVLGMFAPSFVTGHLITRLGITRILALGNALVLFSVAVAAHGETLGHFWLALFLLGVGWNFLFIGGSTLLTTTHTATEKGKVQGVNDLTIFTLVTAGSLLAGALLRPLGWDGLNLAMLPVVALLTIAVAWLWFDDTRASSAPRAEP
ncbi:MULTISPECIES: MFS transporter [unclassified Thioalkalivibrio]|uniref:MFS transporter n=1 Tax=unclassified Thioalkalivibrio TaxID=2621013 RepID=UPI00037E875B|nr:MULTISPECIES: MFS transporter [unclassified Thioalkalivibrio]